MKSEIKQVLEVMTTMHDEVIGRLTNIETDVSELKTSVSGLETSVSGLETDVSKLKTSVSGLETDVSSLKVNYTDLKHGQMQIEANLAQTERTLFNQIASVHEDLSKRVDNHDGFTKEIDYVRGRVNKIETHLGLEVA